MSKSKDDVIKILLISANPSGTGALKLDEEVRAIKHRVRLSGFRDLIRIETAEAARPAELIDAMNQHEPHVVQFSGHGSRGRGVLVCDERGRAKAIGGEGLAALFASTQVNVQVVVLNACYTAEQAEAVAKVVPCVVGMSAALGDRAARVFAAAFYGALGYGKSVEVAFQQGLAAMELERVQHRGKPTLSTRDGVKASEVVPVNPPSPTLRR